MPSRGTTRSTCARLRKSRRASVVSRAAAGVTRPPSCPTKGGGALLEERLRSLALVLRRGERTERRRLERQRVWQRHVETGVHQLDAPRQGKRRVHENL